MTVPREPGRRELNKADKQRRIRTAARELFSRHGYSSVTTQEVADMAEVGTGTLFRYARSKGELLCMVANEDFLAMIDTVPDTGDPVGDLVELCQPLLTALTHQPENIVAYHRETLFGEPGPQRAEAQRILNELRGIIAVILARHAGRTPGSDDLTGPAQTVFDVMYMTIVRSGVEWSPTRDHRAELRHQVHCVLHGALPVAAAGAAPAGPSPDDAGTGAPGGD